MVEIVYKRLDDGTRALSAAGTVEIGDGEAGDFSLQGGEVGADFVGGGDGHRSISGNLRTIHRR
jgi:hypothetical protein